MRVKLKNSITIIVVITLVFSACEKDKPSTVPSVATTKVVNITTESAESGGIILDNGGSPVTTSGACWSISKDPTVNDPKTSDQIKDGHFSSKLLSLIPGTTYHVRAYATNSVGTTYGADSSFATLGKSPSCITLAASDITSSTATLNGTVNPNDLSAIVTFEYGTTTSYESTVTATQSPVKGNTIVNVSAALTGMNPATTYHYRIKSVNSLGTTLGDDKTFTILGQAPLVTTLNATNITANNATLNGTVNAFNTSTTVSFEYGTTTSYGKSIPASPSLVSGQTITNVSAGISGLNTETTYHYRIITVNTLDTTPGEDMSFTTLPPPPPDVYVAGSGYNGSKQVAMLWKNGVAQAMKEGTFANSVYVSGSDVYVAGIEYIGGDGVAKLWKNGVIENLTDGTKNGNVSSVYVSGADVYVAGYDGILAKLWKNGSATALTDGTGDAKANSVFVSGSDVYVAGYENIGVYYVARLWKNGVATALTDGILNSAFANSVYVSGGDVYVAGYENNGSNEVAMIWKNGVPQPLSYGTDHAFAFSVYVSGNDMYVAGNEIIGSKRVAMLWKNGVATALTDGTNTAFAYSVYVSDSDVYVAGYELNGPAYIAKLWKNGVPQNLTDGTNSAFSNSVFVVPHN